MKILLAFIPALLYAQSGLDRPSLGKVIDRQGFLHSVSGIGGSFLLEASGTPGVLSFACSKYLCIAKAKDSILFYGESAGLTTAPAPPGPAGIALDDTGAVIYFRGTGQFARWYPGERTSRWLRLAQGKELPSHGGQRVCCARVTEDTAALDITVSGEILSLRSTPAGIELAVRRAGSIWITSADGSILDTLPAAAQTVLLLSEAAVYATAVELVLRRADGSELRFPAAGVRELFAMGDGWVEARSRSAMFALRTEAGREQVFLLPEPPRGAVE
jgi:hypothetical protein